MGEHIFLYKERNKNIMKIKLKDNTELVVLESCTSTSIVAEFDNVADIETFREKLTDENLSSFKYVNDNGDIFGNYKNYTFDSVTYSEKDGVFTATYNLHQYSDIEVRIKELEITQALQDNAIDDLASANYN